MTFEENDRLLGHFAAERITAIKNGKEIIDDYVKSSEKNALNVKEKLTNINELVQNFSNNFQQNINSIHSSIDNYVKKKILN